MHDFPELKFLCNILLLSFTCHSSIMTVSFTFGGVLSFSTFNKKKYKSQQFRYLVLSLPWTLGLFSTGAFSSFLETLIPPALTVRETYENRVSYFTSQLVFCWLCKRHRQMLRKTDVMGV